MSSCALLTWAFDAGFFAPPDEWYSDTKQGSSQQQDSSDGAGAGSSRSASPSSLSAPAPGGTRVGPHPLRYTLAVRFYSLLRTRVFPNAVTLDTDIFREQYKHADVSRPICTLVFPPRADCWLARHR